MSTIRVALAGNPNCGKTTLFNAYTGAKHYVGNWAGVTVEKKSGEYRYGDYTIEVIDLPGTYSLSPNSLEEKIARDFIMSDAVDVVINIVDASALERNLYLTTQIIETGTPMVVALNMMDEVEKTGGTIDIDGLSERLAVDFVPIVAVKKRGLEEVMERVIALAEGKVAYRPVAPVYSKKVEDAIEKLQMQLPQRKDALRVIDGDESFILTHNIKMDGLQNITEAVTKERYDSVEIITRNHFFIKNRNFHKLSDAVDTLMLNPVFGIPMFILVMLGVFKLTFDLGNIGLDYIDVFFSDYLSVWVSEAFITMGVAEWMRALVVDGIIGGVGGVLTFVPNIAIMFIAISFLEDSGYMARVAFIMDKYLRRVGLNGKAFIPMILGFGCNVPAIMATRTLDNEKDRLLTILINPFMSCGARLPVYVLFAGAFFPGNETLIMGSLYFLGIVIALLAAFVLRKTILKAGESHFVMEIPPYRLPSVKSLLIHVWERVKGYVYKAGTVIFAASVILWFVMNFNFSGMVEMNESFGASIGGVIGYFLTPLGFGSWQAGLSLLTGLVAKEVVVSNMAIAFGFAEDITAAGFYQNMSGFFTPIAAYAFLVFVLLYTPCVAVIGAIKKETNSWKWTGFSVVYQLAIAWFVAMLVYQVGTFIWG
ncbi:MULTISPECIES: ferrous iron transport protein B [unclassified Fusibacter]|uniref:ferrous iron transport protein B n=1 Tax=unclassified Fusibacter TaxID=2624464 RepID=UPI001FA98505|nr:MULTISPECIES: ferrous iron transport protein B [unclassified Fusibacter]MCK8059797.1 ferrous iron transport protein B [Fusibacter sp. A2]